MQYVKNIKGAPHTLPTGRTLSPEEFAEVNENDEEVAASLDDGLLLVVTEDEFREHSGQQPTEQSHEELLARAKELEITGAGKGSLRTKDALKGAIATREAELAAQGDGDENNEEEAK